MKTRLCSECNQPFPLRGRALACSDECKRLRRNRLRHEVPVAERKCSECRGPLPPIKGRSGQYVACSTECRRLRRNRLHEAIGERRVRCLDCGKLLVISAGTKGRPPKRCPDCGIQLALWRSRESKRRRNKADPEKHRERLDAQAIRHAADPERAARRLDSRLHSVYGIDAKIFHAMKAYQEDLCAICGNPPKGRGKGGTLVMDHCHKRGLVRALLCGKCNIAIGLLDDDPAIVDLAAAYLRKWATVESSSAAS